MKSKEECFALKRIVNGYVCSCLVAAVVVFCILLFPFDSVMYHGSIVDIMFGIIWAFQFLFFFALIVAILPASLVIMAGEVFSIRKVWYYMAPAAAVGFWVTWVIDGVQYSAFDSGVFVAAGALAGLMYWYIAGRDAARGSWPRF